MTFTFDAPPVLYWSSNVYALAFSPDGTRLAMGSGGWYGHGALSLIDVASGRETTQRFDAPALTISGVAFDASGQHLAASAWASSQREGPAQLFRLEGDSLAREATLEMPEDEEPSRRCPTGVCFAEGALIVRSAGRRLEDVFASFAVPADVDTRVTSAHRSHAGVVRIGGELLTGGGGSLKLAGWSARDGRYEGHKAAPGLVVGMPARSIEAPLARVTAILARPDGTLITGGLHGELVLWERADAWRAVRVLRGETKRERSIGGAWATYRPESVVALCALEDGRFFSADASGEVLEWHDDVVVQSHALPRPGTPRAMAVHPSTPRGPLLAVGLKCEGGERRGYVACFPL